MDDLSVSAIVVNWNHGHLIQDCLVALLAQSHTPFDVTVVDNGSQDSSAQWIPRRFPTVRLWTFSENQGFARAFNWGVEHTDGALVLSINPDTVTSEHFVAEMVQAMAGNDRIGMVAPKLLRPEDPLLLDSTGLFVDRCRRPYDRGQGERDQGQYDDQLAVFGACGAAALYRRTMLEDVALDGQYFDEDFFAYYEDADLAWRGQSRGWHCIYAPRAVATHVRGWGDTLRKRGHTPSTVSGPRLALRNRYLMTIKNDTTTYFLHDLPHILAAELPRLAYAALTRPRILLGLVDLARAWPTAIKKRREIRRRRTVEEAMVRRWFVAPAGH